MYVTSVRYPCIKDDLLDWKDGWLPAELPAGCHTWTGSTVYEEKEKVTGEERDAKAKRRAKRICNAGEKLPPPRRNGRPTKSGGLTKQTYSFVVRIPGSTQCRKWHVVAYSLIRQWSNRARLHVIEDYPMLRDIRVPLGVFARSKASDTVMASVSAGEEGLYSGMRPLHDDQIPPKMPHALTSHERILPQPRLPSFCPGRDDGIVLPPISSLRPPRSGNYPAVAPQDGGQMFQEDRRILDSFRLQL
ncbi:hypothetical protein C8R43DRAFT_1160419 [Mycena crocata]|nr:hypothetical protein C8R43DRAFT_1160419 [Mycena crocata]